jgi:predicted GTPase
MEEEEKVPLSNIIEEPQELGEKALNVLLIGTSGSGKSSLINYLLGHDLAEVSDSGISCTKDNKFFEITLLNKKLRILDTQGFNDTDLALTKGNRNMASRIMFMLMNESSTRQIDAVWIAHSANSDKCYLEPIFLHFRASLGLKCTG